MKFTQDRIEGLECPAGKKDALFFDDEQRGLAVRVTAGGGKSYLAQYTFAGAKRRIPLGAVSAIKLKAAREAAQVILGEVAKGRDPASDRKAATVEIKRKTAEEAFTLDALLTQWAGSHLTGKRATYATEAVRALRYAFKDRLRKPAAQLNDKAVARVLEGFASAGKPAMAASTMAYGRAAYGWAIGRRLIAHNPFADLSFGHVVKRDRILTDEELRAVWEATAGPGAYNAIVRMLILTGQRREEVAGMTVDEISPDFSTWTLPASRSKNAKLHCVPLSSQAQEVLRKSPRFAKDDADKQGEAGENHTKDDGKAALVFAGEEGVFSGWSKSKARLDGRSGVEGWRLHDLRRTMATGLQKLGVRLEVTEAALNHKSGSRAGIVGVYQVHDWADEKRAALTAWGACVAAIVEKREALDNVTQLRRSA